MKLEDIESEWAKDSKIDRINLDGEQLKVPELHHKYYKMFIRERVALKQEEGEYAIFYKLKTEYYQGRVDQETLEIQKWEPFLLHILKQELPLYLEADKELIERKLKVHLQREKVEYLESILKTLNIRGFTIKNAIDFIKLSNNTNQETLFLRPKYPCIMICVGIMSYSEESLWVRKLDEVYVQVEASAGIHRELSEYFKFRVPGYQFMPAYKAHMWDGYIRLYNANGTIYSGLVDHIKKFADERQYLIEIDKNVTDRQTGFQREDAQKFLQTLKLPHVPHEHQIDAVHDAIVNNRRLLLCPTASGKSLIIYALTRWYHEKTLIIVPTVGLVSQMTADFKDYSDNDHTFDYSNDIHTIYQGQDKNTKKPVVITTWQSIYKQPKMWFDQFGLVIGDEVHSFKATCLKSIMTNLTNTKYRFGTTGTLDGTMTHQLVLEGLFGKTLEVVKSKQLMDKKLLANLSITCACLKYSEAECKAVKKMNYQEEVKYLVEHKERNKFIRNLAISQKQNSLVLFQFVEHGKHLFDEIKKKLAKEDPKRKVFFVAGETEKDARENIRKLTEKEKNAIIVASSGVFSTGINIRNLKVLIFVSPTKSRIKTLQSIGRTLRLGDDSDQATVFDLVDDLSYKTHKNFAVKHFFERVKIYNGEKFKFKIVQVNLKPLNNTVV